MSAPTRGTVLTLSGVRKSFRAGRGDRCVLDGVDLVLGEGRVVGLVGESGCGKSTLARICVGLERADAGSAVLWDGTELVGAGPRTLRRLRPGLQMIFQDPFAAFTPGRRLSASLEPIARRMAGGGGTGRGVGRRVGRKDVRSRVGELFEEVGLLPGHLDRTPSQLSGGQLQRAAIARALLARPRLLIADEVVSALDVRVQDDVMTLLARLTRARGCGTLFISHDLGVIARFCDEIAVMADGTIVEHGPVPEVLAERRHPRTRALIDAVPRLDVPGPAVPGPDVVRPESGPEEGRPRHTPRPPAEPSGG